MSLKHLFKGVNKDYLQTSFKKWLKIIVNFNFENKNTLLMFND